ncbi:ATP-grasp domain-containing protein [Bacillus sp. DTU_2020_1000418_1_SI_GHA_SEK_038]|uniref:ATP-grasp domain-containing protein n=1 Tax=Bacillus sp. DTU_2020_1000418_1_SI_GHA_SEK_038 TaxID=3077585 RepID=UPI0028E792DD|nr:ATP-grasp domain-containing protein [Bacillus sp. DTU_2020_1000418_1_SI_GHA_SEK_038]WNS75026.1 ATP-grasp domain-containing protein [Bacillus sp. DTU_2020_1000418_1_SI_GHA_SEK_038]
MSIKVLVTGARAPVTLHLCRILKDSGHEVYAADSISYALTKSSTSIQGYFLYSSPKFRTEDFVAELVEFIQENKIGLLIPTCEESFYISKYKDAISPYCEVLVGDFAQMLLLHNKFDFIEYVNALGFKAPKTVKCSANKEMPDGELVLKRVYSRFSDHVVFLHKDAFNPSLFDSSWIAQEKIDGVQYCSYGIARDGKLLAHSVYETTFTAGIGATIAFSYCERKDIEHFVRTVVSDLKFTGQISFDFIVNYEDVAIPIECNPRATSGLHLFDHQAAECFFDDTENTLYPDLETKMAICLALLAYGFDNWKRGRGFMNWLKTLLTYRDITWSLQDLTPFFFQFYSMYALWQESKTNGTTMIQQSTSDISWDEED